MTALLALLGTAFGRWVLGAAAVLLVNLGVGLYEHHAGYAEANAYWKAEAAKEQARQAAAAQASIAAAAARERAAEQRASDLETEVAADTDKLNRADAEGADHDKRLPPECKPATASDIGTPADLERLQRLAR